MKDPNNRTTLPLQGKTVTGRGAALPLHFPQWEEKKWRFPEWTASPYHSDVKSGTARSVPNSARQVTVKWRRKAEHICGTVRLQTWVSRSSQEGAHRDGVSGARPLKSHAFTRTREREDASGELRYIHWRDQSVKGRYPVIWHN